MTQPEIVTEGKTKVFVYKKKTSKKGPGSKDKLPFYNPSMELNRDSSVIINQFLVDNSKKKLCVLDGLASSGIRGVRIAHEVSGNFEIIINDWSTNAYDLIKKNIKNCNLEDATASNNNLNVLLSKQRFDYIDIDPFGSPIDFIDSAVRSIKNNGIIGLTATDTASLCGVYPKVCQRRYGAKPFHSAIMKEVGLRILLGVLCREAGKYDKGIEPIMSYSTDHYFRCYVKIIKGVEKSNESVENLKIVNPNDFIFLNKKDELIGPLWVGKLQDKAVLEKLREIIFEKQLGTKNQLWKLIDILEEENNAPLFFYTTENLASILKTSPPKFNKIFEELRKKGYDVFRTHFSPTGFKTNTPFDEIEKLFGHN